MASFNKITIIGYLGRDPELRYTPQGTAVGRLSVATTKKKKSIAGKVEDITTWFRVTLWGKQAELAEQYLAKGSQVYIDGELYVEEYADREGAIHKSVEVTANAIQFIDRREGDPSLKKDTIADIASTPAPAVLEEEEDEVPF